MLLKTRRLDIRPFAETDLGEFTKLLEIPEVPGCQRQSGDAGAFLDWHIANYAKMDIVHGVVCLGVFDRETGEILGAVGAGEHDDLHETKIFYQLLPSARGMGFATEAAMAVTDRALGSYDIPYLIGTVGVENVASHRVLEKCGYRFIDERELLVHIENKRYRFRYYRRYRQ